LRIPASGNLRRPLRRERLSFAGRIVMSKADCERFDFSQPGPTSNEFVGSAIARNMHNHKADSGTISRTFEALIAQSNALKDQAEQKLQQFKQAQQQSTSTNGEFMAAIKLDLDAAWEQLALAWYELKLAAEKNGNLQH